MCLCSFVVVLFFFFKQKTAYELRISDWSSDVCSSDLGGELTGSMRCEVSMSFDNPANDLRADLITRYLRPLPEQNARFSKAYQIGRASCRERVCQYV